MKQLYALSQPCSVLVILFIIRNVEIFIFRSEDIFAIQSVIFGKDAIHNDRYITFVRLEENDEILHRAVSGADIYRTDTFLDRLPHIIQCLFDVFDICSVVGNGMHGDHNQIAVMVMADAETVHIFVYFGKFTVVQIQGAGIVTAVAQ